jgi:hypothetical protein
MLSAGLPIMRVNLTPLPSDPNEPAVIVVNSRLILDFLNVLTSHSPINCLSLAMVQLLF